MRTKMFVISVDEYDAAIVEEFLDSMYEHKMLAFRTSRNSVKLKAIKLLFSYPIDHHGRCLDHQGGDNGSDQDDKRTNPKERKLPGSRQ